MPDQIAYINTRGAARHLAMLLPLALALAGVWFSGRWYLGDTIAENLDPDNRGIETARMSVRLASDDPLTHWRLAEIEVSTLPPDQIGQAIAEYEQAARLSPNDYRFWLSLGRALEQSGDSVRGERAMRRAVDLAPEYSYPRWFLGNLLLRSGHEPEAFAELRRASETNPELRTQVFSLAWQVYGPHTAELTTAIGPAAVTRAEFARYLIDFGQLDEGLKIWNGLTTAEKMESQAIGQAILKSVLAGKHFRQALELSNDTTPEGSERATVGSILDGGGEQNTPANHGPFGWQIRSTKQAQITFDPGTYHSGSHSLRLQFQAPGKAEFSASQLVIVEPGKEYELDCYVKTRQLASAGSPVVEVIDATDGALLGTSQAAPTDSTDWQPIAFTFKTGVKAEAVVIRINRSACGDNAICPIFGDVWYDDFNLKRRG